MKSYNRRQFLRTTAITAAGVSLLGRGSSVVGHAGPASAVPAATLTYTNRWGKNNDTHYQGMLYLLSAFKAKHPEITINLSVLPPGPDFQKDMADCAAGGCPDIMNDMSGIFWTDGYLLDLTPYLNADPTWKASFDQQSLAFLRSSGHQWGLCNELSPICMGWNARILEQAGVGSVPTTWAELTDACDKIKRIGKVPTSFSVNATHMFHDLVAGQKGGYEALVANRFDAPQVLEAFRRLKVFVDNKWLMPSEIEQTYQTGSAAFQAGQLGFYMDGIWSIKNNITTKTAPPDLKNHVKFAAFPALAGGTVIENKVATVIGLSAGLSKNPDKLNAAVSFLKFMTSQQVATKWVSLTWSPMGVKVNMKDVPKLDPLPAGWLAARDHATRAYSLPGTKAMQDHGWDDNATATTTLLQGKSPEAALAAYTKFLAKYKS